MVVRVTTTLIHNTLRHQVVMLIIVNTIITLEEIIDLTEGATNVADPTTVTWHVTSVSVAAPRAMVAALTVVNVASPEETFAMHLLV